MSEHTNGSGQFTTTETTRRTVWTQTRKSGGWLPVAIGAIGLAAIGLYHGTSLRDSVQNQLADKTSNALRAEGIDGLNVSFEGRDATVSGTLPAGVDKARVISLVEGVEGVRVASFTGDTSGPSPAPSVSPLPTSTGALPKVSAVATGGKVVLTGSVPSQAAMDAIVAAATSVYGAGNVTNQLMVDATVTDAGLAGFGNVLSAFGKDATATAALAEGTLTLSGSVPSADAQRAADAAGAVVTGDSGKVVDQLTVAPPPSPSSSPAPTSSPSPAATSGGGDTTSVQAQLDALPLVLFPTGSNTLTPEAAAIVQKAADILKANPGVKVRLDGHTDDRGNAKINDELSAARAETVEKTLISLGVPADRLSYSYHGYADPKVANRDDAARSQNRRVTFTVIS